MDFGPHLLEGSLKGSGLTGGMLTASKKCFIVCTGTPLMLAQNVKQSFTCNVERLLAHSGSSRNTVYLLLMMTTYHLFM